MSETGVGRLLVASLHQSIADMLPMRLEFYESWLNPSGLRDGRIGVAPLAAVLSFLRQEGASYSQVAERAGEYSADWTVAELSGMQRTLLRVAPPSIRLRLVTPAGQADGPPDMCRQPRGRPREAAARSPSTSRAHSSARCARAWRSRCVSSTRRRSAGRCTCSISTPTSEPSSAGRQGEANA